MIVIRIKYFYDIFCQIILLNSLLVITLVKRIKAEAVHWLCIPDSECIDNAIAISYNWHVIWNRLYALVIFLIPDCSAIFFTAGYISTELDDLGIFRTSQLKWISISEPVIRNLLLESVSDLLLEHTIMVADTTAICCISKCRK